MLLLKNFANNVALQIINLLPLKKIQNVERSDLIGYYRHELNIRNLFCVYQKHHQAVAASLNYKLKI